MIGANILVVEDEAIIADDLERTLKRLGYKVPAVLDSGDRAIEAASSLSPALVLMDIKLRGAIDGVTAARIIRDRLEIPTVFLTSYSDTATLSRASAARPYGYVLKPFAERDLRVSVELALHKHEVEKTLRTRERWFATTLNSVGDGVLAVDERLNVTFLNRVAEELTGWRSGEALGRPADEVFPLIDAHDNPIEGPATRALSNRAVSHLPSAVRLRRRDGTTVLVDDSAAPICDPSGQILGVVVVFRDVTERRELEQRVARSERLASLGTLSAGLSHEINNPLTCVVAGVAFGLEILDEPERRTDLRATLVDAHSAAVRIGDIVKDIRTFARPGDGRRAETDLRDVLEAAVKLTSHLLRQRATLVRRYGDAPHVTVDPARMTQVFVNLLANAAQATPEGDADHHTIELSLSNDEAGDAIVEVRDEGEGIAPEALPRVFDPFFTTKSPGGGMGLGLSISNSIVEAFGGAISVESVVRSGTTIRVRLPSSSSPPATR
ncbi:MAG: ATP-binding protein [Polyangiales bacterium]